MTTNQLKDFIIQSMDIYSNTLGINQNLVKQFTDAASNFINNTNNIVIAIEPTNAVSVTDLTPDVMTQNYPALTEKLNINIRNF